MLLENANSSVDQKTAIVTGGTGAIGYAIARQLAIQFGYRVILACRNEKKAQEAVTNIKKENEHATVCYCLVDVSRQQSIVNFSGRWAGRLDVLINNAAATPRHRLQTPEGIEMQFATNVLGYFWMTELLKQRLIESSPSRIVNVASYWAGGLDMSDPEFTKRTYNNDAAYRQSKQADRMLTVAFSEELKSKGVNVNSCHPGDLNSRLSRDLGFGGHESPDQAAVTPVWLATNKEIEGATGKYFERKQENLCRFSSDSQSIQALYNYCLRRSE